MIKKIFDVMSLVAIADVAFTNEGDANAPGIGSL